jgi:hypothetical protein
MRTDPCPVCATPRPANRASDEPWCCSIECYRAFWHDPAPPRDEPTARPPDEPPRRPPTVYECDRCGHRSLDEQRCPHCAALMGRAGAGGRCPHCCAPVTVIDLLAPRR